MGSNLSVLLRGELRNRLNWNALLHEQDTKKKTKTLAMILLLAFVVVMMGGYCYALAYGLTLMGLADLIPGYALTVTSLVTLMFTFVKTNGVLFAPRDYDLLMSLPIRTTTVIASKFLAMYVNNLAFTVVVMLPMGVGYLSGTGVSVANVLMWLTGTLLAPLLPMTIAAIVGTLIAAIGSGARHKTLVQVLLSVGLVVVIIAGSFWMQGEAARDEAAFLATIKDVSNMLSGMIHKIYPPSAWFDSAMKGEQVLSSILLFAGSAVGIYGVFLCACARFYGRINTALMSHHAKSNYQVKELQASSVMGTLVKKEAKRFFSSSVYVTNMGIGLILALLAAIASLAVGLDAVIAGIGIVQLGVIRERLVYLMPMAVAMLVNMTCTSSVSLSLEGRNLWIVQSLPIEKKTLYKAKILFNILLVLPVSLVCSLIFGFELKVSAIQLLLYLLVSVVSVIFSSILGMWINLSFPKYEWQNEVEVIKQSLASLLAIIGGMVFYLIMAAGVFAACEVIAGELVLLVLCLILGGAAAGIYKTGVAGK